MVLCFKNSPNQVKQPPALDSLPPYACFFVHNSSKNVLCGGTLIHKKQIHIFYPTKLLTDIFFSRYIVTSASCLKRNEENLFSKVYITSKYFFCYTLKNLRKIRGFLDMWERVLSSTRSTR